VNRRKNQIPMIMEVRGIWRKAFLLRILEGTSKEHQSNEWEFDMLEEINLNLVGSRGDSHFKVVKGEMSLKMRPADDLEKNRATKNHV